MNTVHKCLVTFISGALVEGICARWVISVAAKQALRSAGLSFFWAIAILMGMGEALHYGWPAATWVAGYTIGSYVAVKMS